MFGRIGTQAGLEALSAPRKAAPGTEFRLGGPFQVRLSKEHFETQRAMRIFEGRRVRTLSSRFETLVASRPSHRQSVRDPRRRLHDGAEMSV